jgi:Flp pilus assembly protein TadG
MLTRFLKNARGGVAPLMAVVAVPVMGAVGMAVDYTRVNAARTAFQVALDSTALMMSKDAATKTDAERQTEATKTFSALFNRPEVTGRHSDAHLHRSRRIETDLECTAVVHTNFLGVIGISQVDISAMSVSTWGNTRLRVALVLDNTGSMAKRRKNGRAEDCFALICLSQLQAPATHPEDVYVSVVPFSKDVNFGSDNYAASWLRWDLWDPVNGTCSNNITCVSHGKIWTPAPHSTWNGCVNRPRPELRHQKRRTGRRAQLCIRPSNTHPARLR